MARRDVPIILLFLAVVYLFSLGVNYWIYTAKAASSLKVLAVDHERGEVTLLLVAHNTHIRARLLDEQEAEAAGVPHEPEIRLRAGEFYRSEFEAGAVETTKPNLIRVDVPDERPMRFRILKITFLE